MKNPLVIKMSLANTHGVVADDVYEYIDSNAENVAVSRMWWKKESAYPTL